LCGPPGDHSAQLRSPGQGERETSYTPFTWFSYGSNTTLLLRRNNILLRKANNENSYLTMRFRYVIIMRFDDVIITRFHYVIIDALLTNAASIVERNVTGEAAGIHINCFLLLLLPL